MGGTPTWTEEQAAAFGRRLRYFRELRGFSQRDLSLGSSVTAAYVSRIEKGARYPSVVVIRQFAARLGVSAEELEFGDDAPVVSVRVRADQIDETAERTGARLRWGDLDPNEQRMVVLGVHDEILRILVARLFAIEQLRHFGAVGR